MIIDQLFIAFRNAGKLGF